jgi:kexin
MLWGSALDATKAKPYALPAAATPSESAASTSVSASVRPKPTANLPSDHASAPGETHKPSLGQVGNTQNSTTVSPPTPSMSTTPDEGYFSHMSDLVSSSTWLFGAVGAVVLFGCGAGIFFWRRRQARLKGAYALAEGDDVPMGSMDPSATRLLSRSSGNSGRTKELYDAFGEVSDEEDDEEATAPRGGGMHSTTSLRYHDAFLDDDDQSPMAPIYKDEPSQADIQRERGAALAPSDSRGPSSPGSGSGSWEHASDGPPGV